MRGTIAADPNVAHDAVIADIGLAPCNAESQVGSAAEVVILRPVGGGNDTRLLELPNRGRKLMPTLFDDALEAPPQRLEAKTRALAGYFAPMHKRRANEVAVAVHALNRMLEMRRPGAPTWPDPERDWDQCPARLIHAPR